MRPRRATRSGFPRRPADCSPGAWSHQRAASARGRHCDLRGTAWSNACKVLRRWIDRTPRPRPLLIVGALVAVAGVLTGGYLLGASRIPDAHDARAELVPATRAAFKRAYETGYDRGVSRGRAAGAAAGRRAGAARGARDGRDAAGSTIHRARA